MTRPPWLSTRSLAASRKRLGSTPENTNVLPVKASAWPFTTSCTTARREQDRHGGQCAVECDRMVTGTRWWFEDEHGQVPASCSVPAGLCCVQGSAVGGAPWSRGWVVAAPPWAHQTGPRVQSSGCRTTQAAGQPQAAPNFALALPHHAYVAVDTYSGLRSGGVAELCRRKVHSPAPCLPTCPCPALAAQQQQPQPVLWLS